MIFQLCLHRHEVEVYSLLETGHNTSFLDFSSFRQSPAKLRRSIFSPIHGKGGGRDTLASARQFALQEKKKSMNTSVGKVGRCKVVILSQAVGGNRYLPTYSCQPLLGLLLQMRSWLFLELYAAGSKLVVSCTLEIVGCLLLVCFMC